MIFLDDMDPPSTYEKNSFTSIEIRKKTNTVCQKVTSYDREKYIMYFLINDYSKSLTFAPIQSEEYAAALANRSAVLKGLSKFNESIIDIDAALQITKDPIIKFKLLCWKVERLASLNKKSEAKEFLEDSLKIAESFTETLKNNCITKLNNAIEIKPLQWKSKKWWNQARYVSNFISNAITWNYSNKYGNHLVANRDIKVGKWLFIESFYVGYPQIDKLYMLCSNCLNFTSNSIPCKSCTHAVYCSETCMNESFEKLHETECKICNYLLKYPESFAGRMSFLSSIRFFATILKEYGGVENLV